MRSRSDTVRRFATAYPDFEDDPRRSDIVSRRSARFFARGGLCEAYERRGERLVQFGRIADVLVDTLPAVSREVVVRRFLFSVETDLFGRHGARGTIERLLDLDAYSFVSRGKYSLRPSYNRVESSPALMRAPRSVWAKWVQAMGWPVPAELEQPNAVPKHVSSSAGVLLERDKLEALLVPNDTPLSGPEPSGTVGAEARAERELRALVGRYEGGCGTPTRAGPMGARVRPRNKGSGPRLGQSRVGPSKPVAAWAAAKTRRGETFRQLKSRRCLRAAFGDVFPAHRDAR